MILAAYYAEAEAHLANGEYDEAREAFVNAGEYKDAAGRIDEINEQLYTDGKR